MRKIINPSVCDFETAGESSDQINGWRHIQDLLYTVDNPYVGNKRKIIVDIARSLEAEKLQYDSVVDLFSGSGVVSLFFKLIGKNVYSNDILTSSYFNALCFVENRGTRLSKEDMRFLCKNINANKGDFVSKRFQDRFTPTECEFLDNYWANVQELGDEYKKAAAYLTIIHYVMNKCYLGGRLNKGQIIAQLDHRIAHNRNQGHQMAFQLKPLPVFDGDRTKKYFAHNLDALYFLNKVPLPVGEYLLYLDPPYGQAQSDYAQMFRFCEEYVCQMALEDMHHLLDSKKFVTQKDYESHFRELLVHSARFPFLAVSYNDSSWANVEAIRKVLLDFKKEVKVINIDHTYKYRKNRGGTEYLLIAK